MKLINIEKISIAGICELEDLEYLIVSVIPYTKDPVLIKRIMNIKELQNYLGSQSRYHGLGEDVISIIPIETENNGIRKLDIDRIMNQF